MALSQDSGDREDVEAEGARELSLGFFIVVRLATEAETPA